MRNPERLERGEVAFDERSSADSFIKFFLNIGKLKRIERRGWVLREVRDPESIADHSFRVALMALMIGIGRKDLNLERLLKEALVHDLAEILTGDITPYDKEENIKKALEKWVGVKEPFRLEKREKEVLALKKLVEGLGEEDARAIFDSWNDYDLSESKEAKLVYQIDRLEMLFQAIEYQLQENKFPIEPFWEDVGGSLKDEGLREIFERLEARFRSKKKQKK